MKIIIDPNCRCESKWIGHDFMNKTQNDGKCCVIGRKTVYSLSWLLDICISYKGKVIDPLHSFGPSRSYCWSYKRTRCGKSII